MLRNNALDSCIHACMPIIIAIASYVQIMLRAQIIYCRFHESLSKPNLDILYEYEHQSFYSHSYTAQNLLELFTKYFELYDN